MPTRPPTSPVALVAHRALPELVTVEELASWLKTTAKAVYARAARGGIPGAVHFGRRLYFVRSELLLWLEQGRVPHLGGPSGST